MPQDFSLSPGGSAQYHRRPIQPQAGEVHDELVANMVANGHMVPAGVMALTRAQEHGYSLLYSAA